MNAALAELKSERFGPDRTQLAKAVELLERALVVEPTSARARFFRTVARRAEGDAAGALEVLEALASEYPRDREVRRQLGQTLLTLGRTWDARVAFDQAIALANTAAEAAHIRMHLDRLQRDSAPVVRAAQK